MSVQTPAERAQEEGASPFLVRLVERLQARVPRVAGGAGLAASVYGRFLRHRGSVLAGGLAFFALLSLVPAFLSLGAVVALVFDPAAFVENVVEAFDDRPELIEGFAPLLDQIAALGAVDLRSIGLAGLISFGVSLYAASRFVYVGRQVLDIAFELEPAIPNLLSRGAAIVVTLLSQVLVVLAVVAASVVPRVLDELGVGDAYAESIRVVRLPLAAAVVYVMLTASMRFGISARRRVGWVNLGALLGTVLIVVGTLGLGWFLAASTTYSQAIAVLGGVVALEIWLYVIGLAIVGAAEVEGVRNGFRRRDLPRLLASEG